MRLKKWYSSEFPGFSCLMYPRHEAKKSQHPRNTCLKKVSPKSLLSLAEEPRGQPSKTEKLLDNNHSTSTKDEKKCASTPTHKDKSQKGMPDLHIHQAVREHPARLPRRWKGRPHRQSGLHLGKLVMSPAPPPQATIPGETTWGTCASILMWQKGCTPPSPWRSGFRGGLVESQDLHHCPAVTRPPPPKCPWRPREENYHPREGGAHPLQHPKKQLRNLDLYLPPQSLIKHYQQSQLKQKVWTRPRVSWHHTQNIQDSTENHSAHQEPRRYQTETIDRC